MNSVAFYVIPQGPFYKNDICQINFGNTFLSLPYVLSVGIIFCHIRNKPEMEKKKAGVKGKSSASTEWVAPYMSGF